ncbi:RNA polymerase, sigma 54 subunit, RpoN/SigL [Halobacillus alkaliphilus]|uniref:RNA polymerase, sigma 54 subunit, RpoN/SigL n=1 Tax=Halobacillus alkaliphilus TaxID=396056 RepID=A0A1I2R0T7_9BACI|nr:RNA polymerase factor sigma-54 [Halobacillus alkaliphilus]SFG31521.1 RNA polymerase, sigma 54 subunit, RpoN/SigL [Halobacillus alkaliphilus]
MNLNLTQTQTVGLVMTPEIRQAISLLQYSTTDLWEYLEEQALENPVLTIDEISANYNRAGGEINKTAPSNPVEYFAAREKGWREKLVDQVNWLEVEEDLKEISQFLLLNLDEQGYLRISIEEIIGHLSFSKKKIEHALMLIKEIEPCGLGCFTMKEYLLYQLNKKYPEDQWLYDIVSNHLNDLAERRWSRVAKQVGVSTGRIQSVFAVLKTLQPHPLTGIFGETTSYLTPDLMVKKEQGTYKLTYIPSIASSVRMDPSIADLSVGSPQAQPYVDNCYKQASWLIRSLEQRKETILKVAEVIIEKQNTFLEGGSLRPMTLKEVAKKIDMHESTVSRAVANKAIQTPRGVYELKFFFSSALSKDQEETVSASHVKLLIKDIIDEEDKKRPVSDQKLADQLKNDSEITISRRTVAKYREAMGILSSSKRKE